MNICSMRYSSASMPTRVPCAAEMALSVLAYNLTRAINIVRVKPMMAAIAALGRRDATVRGNARQPAARVITQSRPKADIFARPPE
jgi:hypothetical protein